MSTTRQLEGSALQPLPRALTWRRMLHLGMLGLASDIRDRRAEPELRQRPLTRVLDPRLHRPIFIIGAPRSGTTFLGHCIGRMPEVSYHFEPRLTKAGAQCVYDGTWSARRSAAVFRTSYALLLLATLDGGRRFAEKNPENSFLVPFLAATFPTAQFVHIIRDGRDVAVSHARQPWLAAASAGSGRRGHARQPYGPHVRWWVEPERRAEFPAVSDIVRTAWCWRRFTEAALEGLATLPPSRSIEVRYEQVVSAPLEVGERLAEFLGTPAPGRDALCAGLAEARADSVGQWRRALGKDQVVEVECEIGHLLSQLGYA